MPAPDREPLGSPREEIIMEKRYENKENVMLDIRIAIGENVDDYDLDGIFAEAYEYKIDTDEQGRGLQNTAGFQQIVSESEWWAIAEKHDHRS
jgi:hypothetical protein